MKSKNKHLHSLVALILLIFFIENGYAEECKTVSYVSDGTGSKFCDPGFALKGITCKGPYCDNKIMTCCSYMNGQPDPNVRGGWSNRISEEPPNNYFINSSGWIAGMKCFGRYCDNMSFNYFSTPNMRNSQQCYFTNYFSEERGYDGCSKDYFVSGLACSGAYCDNIKLYCCKRL